MSFVLLQNFIDFPFNHNNFTYIACGECQKSFHSGSDVYEKLKDNNFIGDIEWGQSFNPTKHHARWTINNMVIHDCMPEEDENRIILVEDT